LVDAVDQVEQFTGERPSLSSLATSTTSPLRSDELLELRPVGTDTAHLLAVHGLGTGLPERLELTGKVLLDGADA